MGNKKKKEKPKTFGELRKECLPNGESDNINYCIPVNIGVIAQDKQFDSVKVDLAVAKIMKKLNRCFGKFQKENEKKSRNQLFVMTQYKNDLEMYISNKLRDEYGAELIINATNDEIKSICWITIAAWDGIVSENSEIYNTVKNILSTEYSELGSNDYKLRFPENRPIYQIVLPLDHSSTDKINYLIREIYPHPLETIHTDKAWFDREHYPKQCKNRPKRKNFKANAHKVKRFNKKIGKYEKKIDKQTENVYDLLPWHHAKRAKLPVYAETANLREIYYDVISMKAQKKQNRQMFALMVMAFAGLTFFSVYSDLEYPDLTVRSICLAAYLIFMTTAYIWYWLFVRRIGAHKDYLEFRALAEGMRVQCHWYTANINESVGTHYTVKFQKDMLWAKQAFNAWYMADYKNNEAESQYSPDDFVIKTEWLGTLAVKNGKKYEIIPPEECPDGTKGQYGFYCKRLNEDTSKARFSRIATIILTVISVVVSFILASVLVFNDFAYENWCVFAISMLNLLTLTITYCDNIMAYKELAAKYSYCALLAQKALQDYEYYKAKNDKDTIQAIFRQFGVEALEENAEWLMIKNDREPEVPN